jgi:hypothetical protein
MSRTTTQFPPTGWQKRLPTEEYLYDQIKLTVENSWHNRLSRPDIETWLSNFTGEVYPRKYEQRLALWLLTNFVYYNEREVRHLCRELFRKFVHEVARRSSGGSDQGTQLLPSAITQSPFLPLGRAGESGAFLLYLFRQENDLAVSVCGRREDESSDTDDLLLLDDVTLSGTQATQYVSREFQKHGRVYLLTLLAAQDAIDSLSDQGITVIECVTLDARSRAFAAGSAPFQDFPADLDPCRTVAENYGSQLFPGHPLGYDCGQYLFGFYYNTPNNTLPIFWSDRNGWKPVFSRHKKVYRGTTFAELGRFV